MILIFNLVLIRGNLTETDFVSPETKRLENFIAKLENIKFKHALVSFLFTNWSSAAHVINTEKLVMKLKEKFQ